MLDQVPARFEVLDERFRGIGGDRWLQRLHTGCRWTEGAAYFAAGRYYVFSDIPNDRMLRWDETTGAVGVFRAAVRLRQRPHRRSAGPAGQLRARQPAGHPHRAGRVGDRARRPVRGQAAQQPQRRGGELGRLDLVHRPGVRHRHRLRGLPAPERDRRLPRVPGGAPTARCASPPTTSPGPTGCASRPTSARSTSPTPQRAHIRRFDVADGRGAQRRRGLRRVRRRHVRRAAAGLRRPAVGRRPRRPALLRPRRHPASASCTCPRRSPTSPSAGRGATTSSSAPRPRSTWCG